LEVFFTVEYLCRVYAAGAEVQCVANPTALYPALPQRSTPTPCRYAGWNRIHYCLTFYALIDAVSTFPCYVDFFTVNSKSVTSFVRCLRLLRLLKADEYMGAFAVFDDILVNNADVLTVTGVAAAIMWVFFSAILYYTERHNPYLVSPERTDANGFAIPGTGVPYYNSIPNSMWVTLLNLSGEYPLCDYTPAGKVITAIIGIFSTGAFTIPVGILQSGFEHWIDPEGILTAF